MTLESYSQIVKQNPLLGLSCVRGIENTYKRLKVFEALVQGCCFTYWYMWFLYLPVYLVVVTLVISDCLNSDTIFQRTGWVVVTIVVCL